MKKHFAIRVHGVVQGVFFRYAAKKQAETLGVQGFVRNEPDGSLYLEAEGEAESLKEFSAWCRRGPREAKVERIEVTSQPMTNQFKTFSVL